jgi:hypothetical protein
MFSLANVDFGVRISPLKLRSQSEVLYRILGFVIPRKFSGAACANTS